VFFSHRSVYPPRRVGGKITGNALMLTFGALAMVSKKILIALAAGCLAASVGFANESCDPGFNQQYHESLRIVDSLRLDKPGQMRVFASDGSEFTGGEALWLRARLRQVDRACGRADQVVAARLLCGVQVLLTAHQRHS
jgi:hypothetical protein